MPRSVSKHSPTSPDPLPGIHTTLPIPQERPEDVPTGELPRTLLMVADRHLVGRVTPGTRVRVTGIYCTHRSQVRGPGSWQALLSCQPCMLRIKLSVCR